MSNPVYRIDIEACRLGNRGQLYRVHYAGSVLVAGTHFPEFDGARALLARGIVGKVELWHDGADFPAMLLDVEKAARLSIEESAKSGPRFTRWQPRSDQANGNTVSTSDGSASTAADRAPATLPPGKKSAVLEQPLRPNSSLALEPALTAEI